MVTIENGLYIVKDETQTSYLSKVDLFSTYVWETRWDSYLNLVYFYESNYGIDMLLVLNNPGHIDYYKAIKTKSRHLKILQEKGIYPIGAQPKIKENSKEKRLIYQGLGGKLQIVDKTEVPYGVQSSEYTEEKEKLLVEYNKKLESFEQYKQEIMSKIFNKV